jgi:hypothetical protein
MSEQQLKSLTPDWLTDVERCAESAPPRPRPMLKGVWMWVDRGVAEGLMAMNKWNRKLRQKRVDDYADLMLRRLWDEGTPQMIVFDTDLRMADGQHRCSAIIKSGCGFWCLVVWGVEPSARLNIDRGAVRNSADNLVMAGYSDLLAGDPKRALELANAFVQGMRPTKVSLGPADLQNICEQYQDVFTKTVEIFTGKTKRSFFNRATVRAVIARAIYHDMDPAIADRFVEILISGYGEGQPGDRAVIALRNAYVEEDRGKKKGGTNSNENAAIYAKTAAALHWFSRGEDRKEIKPFIRDPWPIDPADEPTLSLDRVAGNVRRNGTGGLGTGFMVEERTGLPQ